MREGIGKTGLWEREKRKQSHVGHIKACKEPGVCVYVCVLAGVTWRSEFIRFAFQTKHYDCSV